MIRDLTMIVAVMVSVVSVGFGAYKNIEAGNARGFAYEQAYRIMGVVRDSGIAPSAKASILDAALSVIAAPPPVLDLSRSSAGSLEPQICSEAQKAQCTALAADLADRNAACAAAKGVGSACAQAEQDKAQITAQQCVVCFSR
jgi:hypothetical protein